MIEKLKILFPTFTSRICLIVVLGLDAAIAWGILTKPSKIEVILGTELPKSATQVDYYSSSDYGVLCAQISQTEFLETIKKLRLQGNLIQKKTQEKDWYRYTARLDSPYTGERKLKCWMPDMSDERNIYFWSKHDYWRIIKYDNGTVYVVRD